ncbi:MAG: hypothetical protein LRY76_02885 [Alphaproteobacteria bacterium]|nr:hypothetical protein [Alphaproteobacteria bacterium]
MIICLENVPFWDNYPASVCRTTVPRTSLFFPLKVLLPAALNIWFALSVSLSSVEEQDEPDT